MNQNPPTVEMLSRRRLELEAAEAVCEYLPAFTPVKVTMLRRTDLGGGAVHHAIAACVKGLTVYASGSCYEQVIRKLAEGYLRLSARSEDACPLPPVADAPMPPPQPVFEALGEAIRPECAHRIL
jgi:hypothetical protein